MVNVKIKPEKLQGWTLQKIYVYKKSKVKDTIYKFISESSVTLAVMKRLSV